ncbi:Formate efflux transporter [Candidatus Methanomethylophilus alvi Mx1201]|uniref:Formate efflux transporter n=2 Tax=Methanomethylophilus alvi TaxID=1291540 RepID=M9SBS1_METAX|nr:formate/nitrite transporter family protein [Methanomethylophilus alvi]CDF30436.1 putative membrane protein [Methanoculleus sp. CAG:1088]AGI85766.1 Formate efflux transporter [Candidatus Methanomethylophilus alvi Mx1201]MCI5974371.1 formate/nitrite transporter family protein [Methanomethylophilus alvi]MDD7480896.1 formate/nitrite transporter family protein [Methanomethylophilus alvi]MDY7061105.1 formate/nitrite transporter family protein [Methanomethylophilus alvi]
MIQHYMKCFLRAILAGIAIGLGGCIFMGMVTSEYKWVGAILFSIGLFTVFTFRLDLYTGKVGYAVENKPSYLVDLVVIILGNFVGALIIGQMIPMPEAAEVLIVDAKLGGDIDWWRVFCKGVFCGMLMFIAADYYKTQKKYLATFVCVPVFILAGFEHSIADMFYFCASGTFTLDAFLFILVVIVGNAVGGILIPLCKKYMYEDPPTGNPQ